MGERWYVVQTEPLCETAAAGMIGKNGFDIFLPMAEREARTAPGMRSGVVDAPMFRSYLFVAFDALDVAWCRILRYRGVKTILGVNRRKVGEHDPPPLPLPIGWVETLREFLQPMAGRLPLPRPEALTAGARVRLLDGPFAGLQGIVAADDGDRVRILLDILGGVTPTSAPRRSLALTA